MKKTSLRDFYEGKISPYRSYSSYVKEKFGEKVYKIPIHLKGSCPNRDGTKGHGGCIFCGEEGGSFEWESIGSVRSQILTTKERMKKRYNANQFVAYFQNFTNTYLPLSEFEKNLEQCREEGIIGISVSTRPDCIEDSYLKVLESYSSNYEITTELGLQSVNDFTLEKINRGHNLQSFLDAVEKISQYPIRICVHMILDLPWDREEDIIQAARIFNKYKIDEIKIHNLYIIKNTKLGNMFESGSFLPLDMETFIERTILFLEHLNEDVVIGRLTGRAPQSEVENSNWDHSWFYVRDRIVETMLSSGRVQGSKANL